MGWPDRIQRSTLNAWRTPRAQKMLERRLDAFLWMWTAMAILFVVLGALYVVIADDRGDVLYGIFFALFWLVFSVWQMERYILGHRIMQLETTP